MPMIRFETMLTSDRLIRVPEEYAVHMPVSVHVEIDTLEPEFDFEEAERVRARIRKKADEMIANGCPEFDALAEFRVPLADFRFNRDEIHERGQGVY